MRWFFFFGPIWGLFEVALGNRLISLNMEKAMLDKNANLALQHSQICSGHVR